MMQKKQDKFALILILISALLLFYGEFVNQTIGFYANFILLGYVVSKKGSSSKMDWKHMFNLRKVNLSFKTFAQKCELLLVLFTILNIVREEDYTVSNFLGIDMLGDIVFFWVFYRFLILNSLQKANDIPE